MAHGILSVDEKFSILPNIFQKNVPSTKIIPCTRTLSLGWDFCRFFLCDRPYGIVYNDIFNLTFITIHSKPWCNNLPHAFKFYPLFYAFHLCIASMVLNYSFMITSKIASNMDITTYSCFNSLEPPSCVILTYTKRLTSLTWVLTTGAYILTFSTYLLTRQCYVYNIAPSTTLKHRYVLSVEKHKLAYKIQIH